MEEAGRDTYDPPADGEISEDQSRGLAEDVQKMTDAHIARIDEIVKNKEAEIMQV